MNRCKVAAKETYRGRRSGATVDGMSTTTVFIADRETVNRGLLQQRLSEDGFELVAAAEPRPDLVLGDEAALDRWRGEAPVIVIGRPEADPVDRVRAFRRGCDDYLPRPFHYDELVARIHA